MMTGDSHIYSKKEDDEPLAALATDFAFSKQKRPHSGNVPTSIQDCPLTLSWGPADIVQRQSQGPYVYHICNAYNGLLWTVG